MRFAILSDIHANLEALEVALEIINDQNIKDIICLGDIIGYGANPNECLALIAEYADVILLGNHDEAGVNLAMAEYFNPYARTAIEWTSDRLTKEHRKFLQSLPRYVEKHGMYFVHSSPFQPEWWHYILNPIDAQKNFQYFSGPVCFIGHSHVPAVYCEDPWINDIVRGKRYIVNVGSVGQPRDYDPRLSFGIFDTEQWGYQNIRAEYDVKKTSDKIRNAGLPAILAERLFYGK